MVVVAGKNSHCTSFGGIFHGLLKLFQLLNQDYKICLNNYWFSSIMIVYLFDISVRVLFLSRYSRPEVVKCNCQANFGGELCKEDKRKIRAISSALPGSKTDKPCHYVLRKLRGQIHSPNFPGVFSVPVKCEWVIVTDRKTDTAIHFTESYLQDPAEVRISSFDFYENGNGTNEKVWGDENYQHAFDFQSYPEKL